MGLLDLFRGAPDVSYSRMMPNRTEYGSLDSMLKDIYANWSGDYVDFGKDGAGYLKAPYEVVANMSPAQLWESQPQLRTVIDFIARNLAQLGLHTFTRVDENDRQRDRESPFARTIIRPDVDVTEYEAKYALVVDLLLYDVAYWWVTENRQAGARTPYTFRRVPPAWITPHKADPWTTDYYVMDNGKGGNIKVPADQIVCFGGYSPTRPGEGSPRIKALRQVLVEQLFAMENRNMVWKNGAKASSYISRPSDAPRWSEDARRQFKEDWRNIKSGGVGVLEDGMKLERTDFSARETEFVAATRLTQAQVCAAFHVNPTMIGQNDGSSYSNVREFRRMLYGDTLGPTISQLEDRLNHVLLPMLGMDDEKMYVEFNIQEKMQGSFEEETEALQSATGGPWMTRNEARALQNLPALPDADELIVPLNVIEGGQASPRDSGEQNRTGDHVNPPDAF